MNCANCTTPAMYEYKIAEVKSVFYCSKHLPRFLEPLRKAGNLALTAHSVSENESALAQLSPSKSKKKSAPVVEAPENNEGNS